VLHAARRLAASGVVDRLVITAPEGLAESVADIVANDPHVAVPVRVVDGGPTRQASVAAGLAAASSQDDVVLVHDAARPLASPELARRVVAAVRSGWGAVVPGVAVMDTIKRVSTATVSIAASGGPAVEQVTGTPARDELRAIQTPQGFERALLQRAHAAGASRARADRLAATDDAALVEALGEPVHVVAGEYSALKITTEHDLVVAGLLLQDHA
jgi:2-C-methyl-D-erythritol 4-phosphate cytidylyltransferase